MILPDKKCIFVHVPKTAGKTIRGTITQRHEGWEKANHAYGARPHMDIRELREIMDPDDFASYYKFGFVRNPWDRAVSIFTNRMRLHGKSNFRDFLRLYNNATDFCKWPSRKRYQLDWFTDAEGKVSVDFIGRFENLSKDLSRVCERLGIPVPESFMHEHKRATHGKHHYSKFYDDELREIIERKFDRDIDYFGYRFGED